MRKEEAMRFEDVLHTGRIWAVVYDGDTQDILTKTLSGWMDPLNLLTFFSANQDDLASFFHITNIGQAVFDTIADAASLSCLLLDVNSGIKLDTLFRPLENSRVHEMLLSREKAKGKRVSGHSSWLRMYALKLDDDVYLITGGAIKLTSRMNERPHTLNELMRMEKVRNYLLENGVIDADGIQDFINSEL